MDKKKIIFLVCIAALAIGAIFITTKLVSGIFSLANGALNTVIAIVVIIALIAIVIWMFAYAKSQENKDK